MVAGLDSVVTGTAAETEHSLKLPRPFLLNFGDLARQMVDLPYN